MNIRQIYSLDLSEDNTFLNRFSGISSSLQDWMEENQQEGFIVWNEAGQICYASKSIKRFLNYSHDEIIGKTWNDISNIQIVSEIKTDAAEKNDGTEVFELSYINKDNKKFSTQFITEKIKS